jgi:hypothetical protein
LCGIAESFEFGESRCPGGLSRGHACAVLLVFVSVNQVLVRLWTRVPGTGSGARAVCQMTRRAACGPRVMARCSMACLTGKCVRDGWQPQRSAARVQRRGERLGRAGIGLVAQATGRIRVRTDCVVRGSM